MCFLNAHVADAMRMTQSVKETGYCVVGRTRFHRVHPCTALLLPGFRPKRERYEPRTLSSDAFEASAAGPVALPRSETPGAAATCHQIGGPSARPGPIVPVHNTGGVAPPPNVTDPAVRVGTPQVLQDLPLSYALFIK